MLSTLHRISRPAIKISAKPLSRGFAKEISLEEQKAAADEIGSYIARSRAAQAQIENYSQEQVGIIYIS
jgi:hypothetical protein